MDAIFVVVVVVVVIVPYPWPPLALWTNLTPLYMHIAYPYSNFSPLSNPRSFTCYLSKSGLKSGALHLGIGAFHKTTAHWFEIYLKKYIYFTEMKQIWHKQHTSKALSSVEQHFPSWGQETAARRGAWADGLYLLLASVAGQGSTQHLHLPHGNLLCIPPRASHASHMSISLGRLSPPFLRKKRLRCFLLHIAAEPVNTALLQQL